MTDISQILRISSKTQEYEDANLSSRIVSALERAKLTTNDILTYDITEIVRRTQLSIIEVRTLVDDIAKATAPALDETADVVLANMRWLSTGEQDLDVLLGGGIPCGYITEIVGDRKV
ncbi:DNA repair protein rhp57 [Saitoella coloradoensis]